MINSLSVLVTYKRGHEVDSRFRIVGFTDKYWKCKNVKGGDTLLVRKSNLKLKGSTVQFYPEL